MDRRFRNFIIKRLIKDARFNPINQELDVSRIDLNRTDRKVLILEGRLYGYGESEVNRFIQEIVNEGFRLNTKIVESHSISPATIKSSQHLRITSTAENRTYVDELLKINERFYLLVQHNRGSLMPGFLLETITSPWQTGSYIEFKIVKDELSENLGGCLYKTGTIVSIEFLNPSLLYEALNTKSIEHERPIYALYPNKQDGFGHAVLSLNKNNEMFYVIDQRGESGEFYIINVPKNSIQQMIKNKRTLLNPACENINQPTPETTNIITRKKGQVKYVNDYWKIIKKAKIEFVNSAK